MPRPLLLSLLLLSACRDEAAESFARARLRYDALVSEAARPEDPRFDEVLRALAAVPAASRHHAEAQRLTRAIEGGRRQKVRTPLALAPSGRRPPELEAQLRACARLAALVGADGGVDHRALVALDACRLQAEKLELRYAHGDEAEPLPDGGVHGH